MQSELIIFAKDNYITIVDGSPDIFVSDADFDRILREPQVVNSILETLGRDKFPNGILIGRLGKNFAGVFQDNANHVKVPANGVTRDLCYYETIN